VAKILLASEGVSEKKAVERYTIGLACSLKYDIKLLFVADERYAVELIGGGLHERSVDAIKEEVEEKAKKELEVFRGLSLNIEYRVKTGISHEVVLKELERDEEIKLVIVGYSPTGWLKELVEKPLLPEIIKKRKIPVLIVPEDIREEDFFSVLKC
jgi:nucleotide-binding universal stress UspA family protein